MIINEVRDYKLWTQDLKAKTVKFGKANVTNHNGFGEYRLKMQTIKIQILAFDDNETRLFVDDECDMTLLSVVGDEDWFSDSSVRYKFHEDTDGIKIFLELANAKMQEKCELSTNVLKQIAREAECAYYDEFRGRISGRRFGF